MGVILTAHQPVYLPWLGLFHKIALAEKFVLLDTVQYLPKEWMNRNRIKTSEGPLWLTVPVFRKGHMGRQNREIEIDERLPWRQRHWLNIKTYYSKAPYFDEYSPFFERTYGKEWKCLADLNEYMLKWFLGTLGIETEFLRASDFEFKGAKSDLILDMCRKLGAGTFIFGALGRNYAKEEDFRAAGVKPIFQEYVHPTYPQRFEGFTPNMSVIDLIFNCGPQSLDIIMSEQMLRSRKDVEAFP